MNMLAAKYIILAVLVGLLAGSLFRPYAIEATPVGTFKVNRLTGTTWIWRVNVGQWETCSAQ